MLNVLNKARNILWLEKQPEAALTLLTPWLEKRATLPLAFERPLVELIARSHQVQHRFDVASSLFQSIGDFYEAGYCLVLSGQLPQAMSSWQPLFQQRKNHWAGALYGMLTGHLQHVPTFLQIRNHFEADLSWLIWAKQDALAQKLLDYTDFLADMNYEAYKYAGRALFHAGQWTHVGMYLLKGQKLLPNDPEIYFHLGEFYHAQKQAEEARLMLNQCLLISPAYSPAQELLDHMALES